MGESNVNQLKQTSNEENASLFILESYSLDENQISYQLEAPLCISEIYENEFYHYFHLNYSGILDNDEMFLASIRAIPMKQNELKDNDNDYNYVIRAIIRTKNKNYNITDMINIKNEEFLLRNLFKKSELSSIRQYEIIHHIYANEKLLEFDKYNDEQYSTKIAVIFQRLNQQNEEEIFNNNDLTNEMENFLNLISNRIELKQFSKYRGDLDIKNDEHGIYSYFTIYQTHQIMFNVAPIIPLDKEFIQRKGLIGNALICIVFQEENSIFQPDFILGKVTQVYITVQPINFKSQLYYKIDIWRRNDIESITNPSGGIIKVDESFRDYFLILILNTMNIILKKECFHKRITDQRERLKLEFIQKLFQIFSLYSKEILSNEIDQLSPTQQIHHHHHIGLIPKILEAFSTTREKPTNELIKKHSQTIIKTNPWIINYQKIKHSLLTNTNNSIKSDIIDDSQQISPSIQRSISNETVANLVLNNEKRSSSSLELSTDDHNHLNLLSTNNHKQE